MTDISMCFSVAIGYLSPAIEAGEDLKGGTMETRTIGGPNHGVIKEPCTSCSWVLEFFGIRE